MNVLYLFYQLKQTKMKKLTAAEYREMFTYPSATPKKETRSKALDIYRGIVLILTILAFVIICFLSFSTMGIIAILPVFMCALVFGFGIVMMFEDIFFK